MPAAARAPASPAAARGSHRPETDAGRVLALVVTSLAIVVVGAVAATVLATAPPGTAPTAGTFSWFRALDAPRTWPVTRLPDGAVMPYPPSLTPGRADPGARTAARRDGSAWAAYLNATPWGDAPVLTRGWAKSRVDRLSDEDTGVTEDGEATGLRFAGGARGSCVADHYTTRIGRHRYSEMACLVSAPHRPAVVVVAAASDSSWPAAQPELRRALEAFRA